MSGLLNETTNDEADDEVQETGLNDSSTTPAEENSEATEGEFNAAEWEAQLGYEEGAFKDCKSVEDVLKVAAESADKTILAGLTAPAAEAEPTPFPTIDTSKPETPPVTAPAATGNAEIDALKQRLGLMEAEIKQAKEISQKAILAEQERRLLKEVDSWASPKYGVGKNRNSNQYRAFQAFVGEMRTYIAGRAAMGQDIPDIEVVARRVRAFHEGVLPKTPKGKTVPLGTPGTSKADKGDKGPKNIYDVIKGL